MQEKVSWSFLRHEGAVLPSTDSARADWIMSCHPPASPRASAVAQRYYLWPIGKQDKRSEIFIHSWSPMKAIYYAVPDPCCCSTCQSLTEVIYGRSVDSAAILVWSSSYNVWHWHLLRSAALSKTGSCNLLSGAFLCQARNYKLKLLNRDTFQDVF